MQVDTDGDFVHVFAGRAGAVPDSSFKNYHWRSPDRGATWSAATILGDPAGPPSPGGIAARGGVVHIAYAAIRPGVGTLGHRARYIRSLDNGATWTGTFDITTVSGAYPNHPEIAVGPGALMHIAYRLSQDQATLANADVIGYRLSTDFGATWRTQEVAIDLPTVETHPYNAVATRGFVHVLVGGGTFYHARRNLPEAPGRS